jgi:hypothetical protein
MEYKIYWKDEKRRVFDGMWAGGYYCPGVLYFYVNHFKIKVKKDRFSKQEILGRPWLRDNEWEKAYIYLVAKGFSGFSDDKEKTCVRLVKELNEEYNGDFEAIKEDYRFHFLDVTVFKEDGSFKEYVDALSYLWDSHNLSGIPLYKNEAKNVVDLEARGTGKSFFAAALLCHNFITDGAEGYEQYVDAKKAGEPLRSSSLVGAFDAKYSKGLLDKFLDGYNNLYGSFEEGDMYYMAPFQHETSGSLMPGKDMLASVKDLKTGKVKGSGSMISHRTFQEKATAGNGLRNNLVFIEEAGFMSNLIDAMGALKENTMNSSSKFGVIWVFGTGGEMISGATEQLKEIFYNPEQFDCLGFSDAFEGSAKKIGYFLPYYKGLNDFKDNNLFTKKEQAMKYIDSKRDKLASGSSKEPLNNELQNNPIVPSEAFLISGGNIFPIADLIDQLKFVENCDIPQVNGQLGDLVSDPNATYGVKWSPDLHNKKRACGFPMKSTDDTTGSVQIWEHPAPGEIPYGMYIAATDPYDQDKAPNSVSLGSTFIYKIGDFRHGSAREFIVAEYTARPDRAEEHHENVRRLCAYYNATNLYENEKNSMKFHFKQKKSLHLLAKMPTFLKATEKSNVDRDYGIHMTNKIKEELEIYARDWLNEEDEAGVLGVNKIFSAGLLKELISYNKTGNFDRVIAFLLLICNRLQHHYIKIEEGSGKKIRKDFFLEEKLFE